MEMLLSSFWDSPGNAPLIYLLAAPWGQSPDSNCCRSQAFSHLGRLLPMVILQFAFTTFRSTGVVLEASHPRTSPSREKEELARPPQTNLRIPQAPPQHGVPSFQRD
ncbi:hypothetical protein P7K49_030914 [Saguinus oedipus]|uniref:Uncharacterized protein n=1 Tax=Saguinus oedipus TaxID=9490 RepID=A0ABQ9U4E9_SAGOE|nr:hypothetical protein P7K49_030914 [Saguinus oedipus]